MYHTIYIEKICPCNYEDKMRQHELNPSDFLSSAINSQFSIKILKTASKKSVTFLQILQCTFFKCFYIIATATTTTLYLNYNNYFPFLDFSFWKCCCLWKHKQIMKLQGTFSNKSKPQYMLWTFTYTSSICRLLFYILLFRFLLV